MLSDRRSWIFINSPLLLYVNCRVVFRKVESALYSVHSRLNDCYLSLDKAVCLGERNRRGWNLNSRQRFTFPGRKPLRYQPIHN